MEVLLTTMSALEALVVALEADAMISVQLAELARAHADLGAVHAADLGATTHRYTADCCTYDLAMRKSPTQFR